MLEIKIVFKSGYVGYFTSAKEEEPSEESVLKLRELISNAKQQAMRGSFELEELKTGYLTIIDVQEVAAFGTRLIEKEEVGIKNEQSCTNRKANKRS
jgi:hypothetical protein